jgi:hypothetical protein
MTVVALVSLKGAPGVTTTTCLIGAVWPSDRGVVVVESDPAGGDLAPRFSLPSTRGWPTLTTAVRRGGPDVPLGPHLQQLPGGLEVLLGTRATLKGEPDRSPSVLPTGGWGDHAVHDVLVDLGRIHPDSCRAGGWLDRADLVVVVLGGDAASVLRVHELAGVLGERCAGRLALIDVRRGRYTGAEVGQFVGLPVLGELPYDPGAAAVASGERSGARRLARSALVAAAGHLASAMVERMTASEGGGPDRAADPGTQVPGRGSPAASGSATDSGSATESGSSETPSPARRSDLHSPVGTPGAVGLPVVQPLGVQQ